MGEWCGVHFYVIYINVHLWIMGLLLKKTPLKIELDYPLYIFFYLLHGYPTANFESLSGGQLHSPTVIFGYFLRVSHSRGEGVIFFNPPIKADASLWGTPST